MTWVNVDVATKKFVVHDDACSYIPFTEEIPAKQKRVNRMGEGGGWFAFEHREVALEAVESGHYIGFERKLCLTCDAERIKTPLAKEKATNDHIAQEVADEFYELHVKSWGPDLSRYEDDEE